MKVTHAALAALLSLVVSGCSSKAPEQAATTSPTPSASESVHPANQVDILDTSNGGIYAPRELTVSAGTTVTWLMIGASAHTVQSPKKIFNSSPKCDIKGAGPKFLESTGCLKKGDTFSFTFKTPGEYFYYCLPHGFPGSTLDAPTQGMAGRITVT